MPSYELPEGVERYAFVTNQARHREEMRPDPDGTYVSVSDLDAIRSQEHARVREELLSDRALDIATGAAYTQPISSNRREDMRAAFEAALDSLEERE
jgi:hypothetical protein